jgi:hypothetical protein
VFDILERLGVPILAEFGEPVFVIWSGIVTDKKFEMFGSTAILCGRDFLSDFVELLCEETEGEQLDFGDLEHRGKSCLLGDNCELG